jgi:N-acyl-D-amino-acid deacylase
VFDVLIRNGTVYDGSLRKPYVADIGVRGDAIAELGIIGDVPAAVSVDARGLAVCPGFIDVHGHSDISLLIEPEAESKIVQGVTTEIVGNCGLSPHPITRANARQVRGLLSFIDKAPALEWSWNTTADFMQVLATAQLGINAGALVGGGIIRANVVGLGSAPATRPELDEITSLAERCLAEGALGVSTGLVYAPGIYSTADELTALCAGPRGRHSIYATHLRGYRGRLLPAIEEAVGVGRATGTRVQISHLKLAGSGNWGKASQVLGAIDRARAQGVDVGYDIYPYRAGNTALAALLPPWAHEGGVDAMLERLREPESRKRLRDDMVREVGDWENIAEPGMWGDITISSVATMDNKHLQGMNVEEISREVDKSPEDAIMDLLLEESGKVSMINFHLVEADIEALVQHPAAMIASDGFTATLGSPLCSSAHPRWFGTFPKILGRYVRDRRTLSLEEAIHKMTALPARRFRLSRRGEIVRNAYADIAIFDPAEISDTATYENRNSPPIGMKYVFVNGKAALYDGQVTHGRSGQALRVV